MKRTATQPLIDPREIRLLRAIARRRARFAALLNRLVGLSIDEAARLFRPIVTDMGQYPQPTAHGHRRKGAYRAAL